MVDLDKKRPPPDLMVRLYGSGVKPWSVPTRSLSRILSAVQRLVDQRDDLVDDEESQPDPVVDETRTLQLLSVKAASAGYALSSRNPQLTLAIVRETGKSVRTPAQAQ